MGSFLHYKSSGSPRFEALIFLVFLMAVCLILTVPGA